MRAKQQKWQEVSPQMHASEFREYSMQLYLDFDICLHPDTHNSAFHRLPGGLGLLLELKSGEARAAAQVKPGENAANDHRSDSSIIEVEQCG